MLSLALALLACQESRVPAGSLLYEVTVTAGDNEERLDLGNNDGEADACHPESTEGWQETFTYAVALDASESTIYIDDQVFAIGTVSGCLISYNTVVIGEETEADGEIRWQLFGQADFDPGEGPCVESENDWEGGETYVVVSSEDETLEEDCEYEVVTDGVYKGQTE